MVSDYMLASQSSKFDFEEIGIRRTQIHLSLFDIIRSKPH
jgi:hypothetical protein